MRAGLPQQSTFCYYLYSLLGITELLVASLKSDSEPVLGTLGILLHSWFGYIPDCSQLILNEGLSLVGLISWQCASGNDCFGWHLFYLINEDLDLVLYCHYLKAFNQRLSGNNAAN